MNKKDILSVALLLFSGANLACQQPSATSTSTTAPAATVAPETAPSLEDKARISVAEAKAAVAKGEAVLVDVRGPDAYKMAHIKGSIEHSLGRLEGNDFKGLPKDKQIIAYCSCPAEQSSLRAVTLLGQGGFKNAKALVGGNAAWEASGGEMVKAQPSASDAKPQH